MRSQGFPGGKLQVVGTPLGHLGDLSPRAQQALAAADVVACEDTRRTWQLFKLLGLKPPRLVSFFKDNAVVRLNELVRLVQRGQTVVLVSDGGMPAISDPGAELVAAVRAAAGTVEVLGGPTALTNALAGSGLTGAFTFLGFPPRKAGDLRSLLTDLAERREHLVFYESPQRVLATVQAMLQVWGNRPATLARELTKLHEEWLGPDLASLVAAMVARGEVRGECVLVVAGNRAAAVPKRVPDAELRRRLQQGASVKDVAAWLATANGLSKSAAYALVQAVKRELTDE